MASEVRAQTPSLSECAWRFKPRTYSDRRWDAWIWTVPIVDVQNPIPMTCFRLPQSLPPHAASKSTAFNVQILNPEGATTQTFV